MPIRRHVPTNEQLSALLLLSPVVALPLPLSYLVPVRLSYFVHQSLVVALAARSSSDWHGRAALGRRGSSPG